LQFHSALSAELVPSRYNLGPNGGILTALNLFTTKFDQVLHLVEKRAENVECAVISFLCQESTLTGALHLFSYVVVDTPGQIEIFTWSASGAIITDAIASALPTVVAYIVDTPRTVAPATFMSNMLYACRYVVISASSLCIGGGGRWESSSPSRDLFFFGLAALLYPLALF
jgi:hypothetical protein